MLWQIIKERIWSDGIEMHECDHSDIPEGQSGATKALIVLLGASALIVSIGYTLRPLKDLIDEVWYTQEEKDQHAENSNNQNNNNQNNNNQNNNNSENTINQN